MGSETMTTSTIADFATMTALPQRTKRKAAKNAAAFVTKAIQEEMSVPPHPSPSNKNKRSFARNGGLARANSQSSHGSSASHGNGGLHSVGPGGSPGSSSSHSSGPAPRRSSKSSQPKKKTALSTHAVEYLKSWMMSPDHIEHPYPTEDEKASIMRETGIELKQLTNWFVNNRKRYWKPKVEELRRRSNGCGVSLGEMAGRAQVVTGVVNAPGEAGGMSPGHLTNAHNGGMGMGGSAMAVSSEGEESHQEARRKPTPTNKKRKQYPASGRSKVSASGIHGQAPRTAKKARQGKVLRQPPVAPQSASVVANPIQTTILQSMGTSRVSISSASSAAFSGISSGSEDSSDEEHHAIQAIQSQGKSLRAVESLVSNPLATAPPSAALSSPLIESMMPLAPPAAISAVTSAPIGQALAPPPATFSSLASELDFSMSSLDNQALENQALNNQATSAATAAGFCCNVMPHSCNLADPLGAKNRNAPPCALCSACRDWNLGEFCPWDLTGIIGDLSPDGTIPDPAPSSAHGSSSSEGEGRRLDGEEDFTAPVRTLPEVASSPYANMDGDGVIEEATMVTKNSFSEVADVASIDGNGAGASSDANPSTGVDNEPSMDAGPSVPQEISHSSSAADFISSIVNIEDIESWE